MPGYVAVWCAILLSGLGVAMFHPAAGKAARQDAGDSAGAMSVFAAGGSVGFFLAPALATPALIALGVPATGLFLPPAALICFVLLRKHRREAARGAAAARAGRDRWGPFAALTGIEVLRSAAFFGLNTFIELYWIRHLHASRGLAGVALTCFLAGGVAGTLLGGRIADRVGAVRTVQLGTAVILPALAGLLLVPGRARAAAVRAGHRHRAEHAVRGAGQARPGLPAHPAGHRGRRHPRARRQRRRPDRAAARPDRQPPTARAARCSPCSSSPRSPCCAACCCATLRGSVPGRQGR